MGSISGVAPTTNSEESVLFRPWSLQCAHDLTVLAPLPRDGAPRRILDSDHALLTMTSAQVLATAVNKSLFMPGLFPDGSKL